MKEDSPLTLDELASVAAEKIGALRSRVIRKANGALPYDYIVPNGVYEELWDWDAFFVGLHLISENRADGIYLKNWCLNFLHFTEPDGQTPGGIRPWARRDARLYHIKPLLGQAAYYASLSLGDFGWIEPVWDRMKAGVTYRERKMSDAATGLIKWWDSLESGADNNPALVRTYHNSIAGVDVNAFMLLAYRAMTFIADRLDKPDDTRAFRERAQLLGRAVNVHLWDPGDAGQVAERVTRLCLEDLAANGMMHENYHSETGAPLAAPNFISWNLLVAQMIEEARTRVFKPDPTQALWIE